MPDQVVLLVLAGLRRRDLAHMPRLQALLAPGDEAVLAPSFPCLAGPVQANLLTGATPDRHGIVADCLFARDEGEFAARPVSTDSLQRPPIWEILRQHDPQLVSAAWGSEFACAESESRRDVRAPHGKPSPQPSPKGRGGGADLTPAIELARHRRPDFFYVYLDNLAQVAQRTGPDSDELRQALAELDESLGKLFCAAPDSYGQTRPLWLVTGAYAVSPVRNVFHPNRVLREAGLLELRETGSGPVADLARSRAFAVVDRQLSHVFVAEGQRQTIAKVASLFGRRPEIAEVLSGESRRKYDLEHPRAGDVVLASSPDSWQAYPWWDVTGEAPPWAHAAGAPHKLGADPLEMFGGEVAAPLDTALIKGSHGAPARDESQRSVIFSSEPGVLAGRLLSDTDVCDLVLRQFGI
jgi:hypothetical protein